MKKLIILPILLLSLFAQATNYYVKNSGNDSNTGLSDAQAWLTVAKVNATTLVAGDTVFFNRGDQWRETITISQSGSAGNLITYTAYGTGENPIINGANIVTGWSDNGDNVWYADCPTVTVYRGLGYNYVVLADGVFYDTQVNAIADVTGAGMYYVNTTPTPDVIMFTQQLILIQKQWRCLQECLVL